ncbi:MAG TPA: efflux RND transporter periplasmic adaptor subunit [Terriglobales bacterium]|nr:efflux RND transporter periplasmic adaptor subunit [Terriglobales bacterium]
MMWTALLSTSCSKPVQSASPGPPAFKVKVLTAELQRVDDFIEYISTLKSRHATILQPQVEGYITRIFVKSGDQVRPGEALMEIDPAKQQATVHSQEATRQSKMATLEWTRRELERRKALWAAGVISKQDLDQAQSAYDASKADVDSLAASVREQQVQLHYFTVKAPTEGIVGDIPVRVGDRVTNTTTLTTLDQEGQLEAYISVPAEKSAQVRMGMPVVVVGDDGKPVARAAVTFVSPRVDPQNQLLLVKAIIPNQQHLLRNDQVIRVRVIWREVERPLIPVTSVARVSGRTFAFVAEKTAKGMVAKQRSVKLGEFVGNDYSVLDGIKAGDKVIVTGVQVLNDGMLVAPES